VKVGDARLPTEEGGPKEPGGCADLKDHALKGRRDITREIRWCGRCGGQWSRQLKKAGADGRFRPAESASWICLRPGSGRRGSRSLGPSKAAVLRAGILDGEGAPPQSFEELNRRKREAAQRDEAAELYRRRRR
jgi:hypothetical protein